MNLRLKIFLITFILFLAAFYIGIYAHSNMVYKASLDTVRDQAFTQHNFIVNMLVNDMTARLERERKLNMTINAIMTYYSEYYEKNGVQLELMRGDATLFGSISDQSIHDRFKPNSGWRQSAISSYDGHKYIFVSGYMSGQFSEYILIYSREITSIAEAQESLVNNLVFSGVVITLAFILVLYILLNRLMKPVQILQRTSEQIAAGAYGVRARIKGNDEIAQLGSSFNRMADEVLAKIENEEQISFAKQQFIDNLAHELRTPLTIIYGYAEFLQRANASEDDRITATKHIMQQVQRMQAMSAKLLELTITRKGMIDKDEISLAACFDRVHAMLVPCLTQKQICIQISCDDQMILGSEILIEQLLMNLLDNAIKASSEDSIISLKAYGQDAVTIEITDQGKGMGQQEIGRVFEPFYRVDAARSRALGGAGLGLSLCKQIVDAHDAQIEIESQPERGTTIFLFFTKP